MSESSFYSDTDYPNEIIGSEDIMTRPAISPLELPNNNDSEDEIVGLESDESTDFIEDDKKIEFISANCNTINVELKNKHLSNNTILGKLKIVLLSKQFEHSIIRGISALIIMTFVATLILSRMNLFACNFDKTFCFIIKTFIRCVGGIGCGYFSGVICAHYWIMWYQFKHYCESKNIVISRILKSDALLAVFFVGIPMLFAIYVSSMIIS